MRKSTVPLLEEQFVEKLDSIGGKAELGWADIARMLGVSINTARLAVNDLVAQHKLFVERGRGGGVKSVYTLPWARWTERPTRVLFRDEVTETSVRKLCVKALEDGDKCVLVILP